MLSQNDFRVISFLVRRIRERYSINELARQLKVTPRGMHKLLKRLEEQTIVKQQRLANAVYYEINFESDKASKLAEFSIMEDQKKPYVRAQIRDLERLRNLVKSVILFGSVLKKGERANDIDILVILEKNQYKKFHEALKELQNLKTKQIQTVLQTPEEMVVNLKKADPVLESIIKEGHVLWGQDVVVRIIKEAKAK